MVTLKKFGLFMIIYNVIFVLILNLQFIYRFNTQDDFITMLMYSSILSINYSIIPFICFIFSWFISNNLFVRKNLANSTLKLVIFSLITVISTYTLIELIVGDPIFTLIAISTILLTLCLFIYTYRKKGVFTKWDAY